MKSSLTLSLAFFLLGSLFFLVACQNDASKKQVNGSDTTAVNPPQTDSTVLAPEQAVYIAAVNDLRVRETPTLAGTVLMTYKTGDVLTLTGNQSTEKVTVELQGKKITDVFKEVNLARGGQGWVFAGGIERSKGKPKNAEIPLNTNDDDWLVTGEKVGKITKNTTKQDLITLFGKQNVVDEKEIYANGDVPPFAGVIVFKNEPNELEIVWDEKHKNKKISFIMIRGTGSKWHTKQGIQVGIPLTQLNTLNGKPFEFSGLDWDYGGYINNWQKGNLQVLENAISLRLSSEGNTDSRFIGDQTCKSDAKGIEKLRIFVGELSISL